MANKFAAPQMGYTAAAQMSAMAAMAPGFAPKDAEPYASNYYGPTQIRHHFLDNVFYRDAQEMKRIQKLTDAKNQLERMRAQRPHR